MMRILPGMAFPEHLTELRRQKNWTQADLAEASRISVPQLQRYEAGKSQPTLDVIKKLAVALGVSSDALIFDQAERGPDDDLRLQFEAIQRFSPEEKQVAKTLLESLIIRHESFRWHRPGSPPPAQPDTTKEAG